MSNLSRAAKDENVFGVRHGLIVVLFVVCLADLVSRHAGSNINELERDDAFSSR